MKKVIIDLKDFSQKNESNLHQTRQSVRAAIFNNENKLAMIHAQKYNYYVFPGGGVEDYDLNLEEATKRESLEEAGLKVEVEKKFLEIKEIKRFEYKTQISHCFICKTDGKIFKQNLTEGEKEQEYILKWMTVDEAIEKIQSLGYPHFPAKYTSLRNLAILEELKNLGY